MKIRGFSEKRSKSGSSLVLTLLITSIFLVIVLTFVVVVRLEMRRVAEQHSRQQARHNALLAAELALARLQELAGPDTRVTAQADLFRGNGRNVYQPTLAHHADTRHWAGVWDSLSFDGNDARSKGFLGWLVSGEDEGRLSQTGAVATPPGAAASVRLVGPGTVSRAEDEVRVGTVEVAGGQGGRFGFWVGDEGVKARFNLQDPFRGTEDFTQRQYSMRASQRHAGELFTYDSAGTRPLSASGWYPLDSEPFTQMRKRMVGRPHLNLLGWNDASRDAFQAMHGLRFHDLSLVSRGLLTDTARGGLRRDLSLAFEMPLTDFLAHPVFGSASPNSEIPAARPPGFPAGERITPLFRIVDFSPFGFQPENSPNTEARNPPNTIAPVLRGPTWHMLRNYHRSYKAEDPDRARYGLDPVINRTLGARRVAQGRSLYPSPERLSWMRRYAQDPAVWTHSREYGPVGSNFTISRPVEYPTHPGISPIVTRVQIVFSVRTVPEVADGVATGNYVADLYLDPLVTLWNPYNVAVATGERNRQPLQLSFRFLDLRLVMRTGTTEHIRRLADLFEDETGSGSSYDGQRHESFQLTLDDSGPGGLVMEPGEVIIFSGVDQEVRYRRLAGAQGHEDFSGVNLDLRPGIVSFLPDNSGIRFENPWGVSLPPAAQARFRTLRVNQSGWVQKIQVAGVNRTGIPQEPFFGTFEASNINMETAFSVDLPVQGTLDVEKRPFFIYDVFLKNESTELPVNLMSQFNLRAVTYEQGHFTNAESGWLEPSLLVSDLWSGQAARVEGWNGLFSQFIATVGPRGSYWGGSHTAAGGSRRIVLFELPRLPPLSLASLQHAPVVFMVDEPSLPIGNSVAPAMVRPDQKVSLQPLNDRTSGSFPNLLRRWNDPRSPRTRGQWTMTRPDWSYLLNETLWDGFFFSGLTPDPAGTAGVRERLEAFLEGEPLPNSTLRPHVRGGETAADIRSRLLSGSTILPTAPDRSAAHLIQEGSFNVNSTSVEAWRAVLSSTRNLEINLQDRAAPREMSGTVFSRTALPFDAENDRWHGFRNLTDGQIDLLAREIVEQVRMRGPFLNLADFVNRRLHPEDHDSRRSGALQSAIDALPLNESFSRTLHSGGLRATHLNDWVRDRVALSAPVAQGAPGYFMQADILTLIGPILSARSDTFTLRTFGEFGGARAWAEVTVQRLPEFVDPADEPWAAPGGLSAVNQAFGRRFVVTEFRWLNEEEI